MRRINWNKPNEYRPTRPTVDDVAERIGTLASWVDEAMKAEDNGNPFITVAPKADVLERLHDLLRDCASELSEAVRNERHGVPYSEVCNAPQDEHNGVPYSFTVCEQPDDSKDIPWGVWVDE